MMKYILFLSLWCGLSVLAAGTPGAQDRIFLRQGRVIEAKVLEITSTTVRFHRSDNLDGPIYAYEVCDIDYIRLANGTVERFAPCLGKATPGTPSRRGQPEQVERSVLTLETGLNAYIQYTGGSNFLMNNQPVTMLVARSYVQAYCPEALPQFEKGRELIVTGVPLAWIGTLVGTAGLTLAIVNTVDRDVRYVSMYNTYDNGPKRSPVGG